MGATAMVLNALDADQVRRAVATAQPEVIIHELTAIGCIRDSQLRPLVRGHQPAAHRSYGPCSPRDAPLASSGSSPRVRGVAVRSNGRAGQDRGGPARPDPSTQDARVHGRDSPSRDRGHRRSLDRRDRAAIGGFYESRHVAVSRGRAVGAGPESEVPGRRRRRRYLVVHSRRRCRRGDRDRGHTRPARDLQRRRRRPSSGRRLAADPGREDRCPEAVASA